VTFAPRPVVITQNSFTESFAAPLAFPYTGVSTLWTPTNPGYVVTDVSCVPGPLAANFAAVGSGCPGFYGLPIGGVLDDSTHPIVLPFSFPHASGPYTDIVVSSNGFVTLGVPNPGSGCCSGSVSGLLSGQPRIAAFWQDLYACTRPAAGRSRPGSTRPAVSTRSPGEAFPSTR
jgi:hypothetical protein